MERKKYIPPCTDDNATGVCPDDPDLIYLRDAAKDEREAIAMYLEAAVETCYTDLFLEIAGDEMHHYAMLMQHISRLDPVQAKMLTEEHLDFLTVPMQRAPNAKAKWAPQSQPESEEILPPLPHKKDLPLINIITEALAGELEAANKYQTYMGRVRHKENKELFCYLMNDEKEHIAEFTAVLFNITGEPLPPETD